MLNQLNSNARSWFSRLNLSLTTLVTLAAGISLLGAGTAQAATILCQGVTPVACDSTNNNAVLILDLIVPGGDPAGYNVEFVQETGDEIYGPFPGTYPFDQALAQAASEAIVALFNSDAPDVLTVGPSVSPSFFIGYEGELTGGGEEQLLVLEAVRIPTNWNYIGEDESTYNNFGNFAKFTVVPEPGTALLMGLGLAGLGLTGRSRREEGQGAA